MSHIRQLGLAAGAALALSACVTYQPAPAETLTGDYLSGRLAARLNDVGEAADHYVAAAAAAPDDVEVRRNAFFFLLSAGEVERAGDYAKLLTSPGAETDGLARLALAATALRSGALGSALAGTEGPFEQPFLQSIARLVAVYIVAEKEGPKTALAALAAAPDEAFKGFDPTVKALLSEAAGDLKGAREAHQQSVYGFGGPIGRFAYGAFLERHGDAADARAFYETLARQPGPYRRAAEAGLARLDQGRPSRDYEALTAREGASIVFYLYAAAMLDQSIGQRERAAESGFNVGEPRYNLPLALSQIAVFLDPRRAEARQLIGDVFNLYGDHERVKAALAPTELGSPFFEQARVEIAGGLADRGGEAEAIAILEETLKRDPMANEARLTLAGVLGKVSRNEEAVTVLGDAIARLGPKPDVDAWRFFVTRGGALLELGRWPEAEADLKRAVELAPEEPTALNYLGYSWAERGENLEEAFKLIEKAVELEPRSGAIIDSLGWAYYQRGQYQEAVGHLEKAGSLEPADPTVTDHLGDVYYRLGRKLEATYQWRRALDLKPTDKARAAIEKKLKDGLPPAPAAR